jgi:hypothetical protein
VVVAVLVVTLLAIGFAAYYESMTGEQNTYPTNCTITGVGGFEFRVVSSSTGAPVSGENIKAIDRLGCNGESQVVYLDSFSQPVYVTNFTESDGGWLVPDFPSQATPAGGLSFIITYQSATYSFTASIPPIGTNCVTLYVPSGNVTSSTVMNGNGSYC